MTLGREKSKAVRAAAVAVLAALTLASGCAEEASQENTDFAACPADMAGTPWSPEVPGTAATHHDSSVVVTKTTHSQTVPLLGLGQGAACSATNATTCPDTANRIATFTFSISEGLGDNGSLSMVGEPYGLDSSLVGSAWPILVSLVDPNGKEWVNFPLGAASACAEQGFFECDGGYCSQNAGCTTGATSAFKDWSHWRQNNIPAFGYASTNRFPTCNWTGGTPTCHFAEGAGFFSAGQLPVGSYTAKYVLLSDSYSRLSSDYKGGIKLTVVQKKDTTAANLPPTASANGAFDVNVILIGSTNVAESRTAKGKANLNALFEHVHKHFEDSSTGAGVKLGRVTSYEICGETYANVDFTQVGSLLEGGSKLVSASSEGSAINVFLVSTIDYSDANLTILGASGSIGGPMVNGTGSSGVVFSTFNKLDTFNADCTGATCLIADQEKAFIEMGNTVSHELGHYLGLNHLSEMDGSRSDPLPDTPKCASEAGAGGTVVTHNSCRSGGDCLSQCGTYDGVTNFCPTAEGCEFNHVMWYTTKKYNTSTGQGDAHIFSSNSSAVINYNPFVR